MEEQSKGGGGVGMEGECEARCVGFEMVFGVR